MFALYASKNQLEILEKEPVTSGSVNVYKVRFEFSEDWQGLTRKAVFQAGEVSRSALLDESGECVIPWEVLAEYHPLTRLRAGAYGCADETALPTVWADLGIILQGVPSSGKETQQPTPDIYQQIASLAAKVEETARSVREDADAGKFDGEIGPKGEKGDKGDTGPQGPVGTPGMSEADVLSAIGAAVSSPAHMITETYGPAAEVTMDIAAEGSLLHPVSEIKLVQEGEGTPSLSNIRNIVGWDNISLTAYGKNLLDSDKMLDISNWVGRADDFTDDPFITSSANTYEFVIPTKPGVQYTITLNQKNESTAATRLLYLVRLTARTQTRLHMFQLNNAESNIYRPTYTFTTDDDPDTIYLFASYFPDQDVTEFHARSFRSIQVEFGRNSTYFEPHHNETAIQTLPETVYGGTYDWAKGELTVTHKFLSLAIKDMNNSEDYPGWIGDYGLADVVGNDYNAGWNNLRSNTTNYVTIRTRGYTYPRSLLTLPGVSQSEWKTQYPNFICQFVFPLLKSRTIHLPPHEFLALSGANTLSGDCGDTTVTFQADLKKYIDKKLSELTRETGNETV